MIGLVRNEIFRERLRVQQPAARRSHVVAFERSKEHGVAEQNPDLGVGGERLGLPLELARFPDVVGSTRCHELAAGLPDRPVHGRRITAVLLAYHADALAVGFEDARGAVGRAVVDDDHLLGRTGLPEDRVQRLGDPLLRLVGRHHG